MILDLLLLPGEDEQGENVDILPAEGAGVGEKVLKKITSPYMTK